MTMRYRFLLVAVIAVVGAVTGGFTGLARSGGVSATAAILVSPNSDDDGRTQATLAALVETDALNRSIAAAVPGMDEQHVDRAVAAQVVEETNIVEITAVADNGERAAELAQEAAATVINTYSESVRMMQSDYLQRLNAQADSLARTARGAGPRAAAAKSGLTAIITEVASSEVRAAHGAPLTIVSSPSDFEAAGPGAALFIAAGGLAGLLIGLAAATFFSVRRDQSTMPARASL